MTKRKAMAKNRPSSVYKLKIINNKLKITKIIKIVFKTKCMIFFSIRKRDDAFNKIKK